MQADMHFEYNPPLAYTFAARLKHLPRQKHSPAFSSLGSGSIFKYMNPAAEGSQLPPCYKVTNVKRIERERVFFAKQEGCLTY